MTPSSKRPRVYMLYHASDLELAERLATLLRVKHGIDVWLDVWEIGLGDSEIGKIEDAIEASDGGLLLLSEHGLGDALDRATYAALLKRALEAGKYVIPVRHGVAKIPALLEGLRSVDSGNEAAIVRAILRKSDKPPIGDGPPVSVWRLADDIEQLREQASLVIYVGPELAQLAQLPSRAQLCELLLTQLPDEVSDRRRATLAKLCAAPELTDAFTELQRDLGEQRFGRIVEMALDDSRSEVLPELAWAIARLRPRLQGVITPNLDNLLERAFEGHLHAQHAATPGLVSQSGWLLKLNGTRTQWDTWVFTRAQRDRALHHDHTLVEVVGALFMSKSILFVGMPVDDPILSLVIERVRAMARGGKAPRHWALLPSTEADSVVRLKLDEAGISVITYDDDDERLDILESLE